VIATQAVRSYTAFNLESTKGGNKSIKYVENII